MVRDGGHHKKGGMNGKVYPWGHGRRFNSYPERMRTLFGERVQKISVDAGFTCPNRDGTKGTGGCTFCRNDAFNPSYCHPKKSISQQIAEGIEFHRRRYRRAGKYLAYFQAYSNTYGDVERLEALYREALKTDHVIGIVIGTRPDCADDDRLDLLQRLSRHWHVVVEYGIESVYDSTLARVNRRHSFADAVRAVENTASRGICTGGHIIFGLPGESREQMLAGASILSRLPLASIKFHQLQLFRDTPMADEYLKHPGDFHTFTLTEYLDFAADYTERLSPSITIERIAGETPPRYALHRPWGPRYDEILRRFERLLEQRNSWQGRYFIP